MHMNVNDEVRAIEAVWWELVCTVNNTVKYMVSITVSKVVYRPVHDAQYPIDFRVIIALNLEVGK